MKNTPQTKSSTNLTIPAITLASVSLIPMVGLVGIGVYTASLGRGYTTSLAYDLLGPTLVLYGLEVTLGLAAAITALVLAIIVMARSPEKRSRGAIAFAILGVHILLVIWLFVLLSNA